MTEMMREEMGQTNDMYRAITEKGFADLYVKENVREILDRDYNASTSLKPYLMGIFGSGFLVLSVSVTKPNLMGILWSVYHFSKWYNVLRSFLRFSFIDWNFVIFIQYHEVKK